MPEEHLGEILNFIYFLEAKSEMKIMDTAIASEKSLGKDWLLPEEDEAWSDL